MVKRHMFDGERCIHCNVNVYDCSCENDECCNEREPIKYTSETPRGGSMLVRKRPVEVEAFHWDGSAESASVIINWAMSCGATINYVCDTLTEEGLCPEGEEQHHLVVRTLEGDMIARAGYWIIRGVDGEFYGCEPEIFHKTYEGVTEMLLRVDAVIADHQARPLNSPNCMCGWKPQLSLNDTESDRRQHIGHVAECIMHAGQASIAKAAGL